MISRIALTALLFVAMATSTANANSYWVALGDANGQPTITSGRDGFSIEKTGGPWNQWANNCTANPGTYIAGAYCKLRFNVPAGLTAGTPAGGGVAHGQVRTANDFFILRTERPGANPSYVSDVAGDGPFAPGWGALGSYVDIGLYVTGKTTTTSQSNWFHLDDFTVLLNDSSAPTIDYVSVGGGSWKGAGCTPVSYSWSDSGSQMWSASLTNISTGIAADSWTAAPGRTVVQSGVPTAARPTCLPAQPTGTYTYRTVGTDRSGNTSSSDFQVSFDTTAPIIGAPMLAGSEVADQQTINSYRPAITWSVSDANSGLSSAVATLDGTSINVTISGAVATLTPTSDLPLGEHTLTFTATDAVGNSTTINRRIRIVDAVAPIITVRQPGTLGGNTPILDVSATDDRSGVASSTWSVDVNGEPVVVSPAGDRIQADLGYVVNGIHTIRVRVADQFGNYAEQSISYTAKSDNNGPVIPNLTGIQILDAPSTISDGVAVRIQAAAVKAGRPLTGMRAELHQGSTTVAGKPISTDGTVDMSVTLASGAPLTLTVNGSGLLDQDISFKFVAKPASAGKPGAAPAASATKPLPKSIVDHVIDGNSFQLRDGRTVKLLQIDAPDANQCFGGRATHNLKKLLKPGTVVTLSSDAKVGSADGHGHLLRYVTANKKLLNRLLVQSGNAAPSFERGKHGRLAEQLLADATKARKVGHGLWGACAGTKLAPNAAVATGPT